MAWSLGQEFTVTGFEHPLKRVVFQTRCSWRGSAETVLGKTVKPAEATTRATAENAWGIAAGREKAFTAEYHGHQATDP